ncbi:XRE family transcriptional regulator [Stenomitos frigidus]|nr:XRE family transcriptional regulator [Stenomitos frigidus]
MGDNTNLFWFGFLVEFIFILAIVKIVDLGSKSNDKLDAERNRLRREYERLEQTFQQKAELTQESLRLQELQRRSEQLAAQAHPLVQGASHPDALASEHLQRQQALQQENDRLTQECLQLRQALQQEAMRTTAMRHSLFKQLQTLFTHYPSLSKIIEAKPDLPAKSLTPMFVPLEELLQSWGYSPIGAAWEQVAYDPKLHQPDAPDIAVGELVYVRYVGYRDGDTILSPAKVSRTLTKAIGT